jgi:gas vesicle protein
MANRRGKDLLTGAVVGGLLGAVTALLFAPKSGKELRSDIANQYHQVSEKTQKVAGQITEKSKEVASGVGQKTQEIVRAVSEHTTEWAGKTKEAALQLAEHVKSWRGSKQAGPSDEAQSAEASIAATAVENDDK